MTNAGINPSTAGSWRWTTCSVPFVLAFLACLPDSMSYPGLKAVVSDRFQQDDASTQLFTIAALVGAVVVIPLLGTLRRFHPRNVLLVAGLLQAGVVGAMALPVPWWALLGLRGLQGGFDLLTLALITTVAARINGGSGRTFGLLGSAIMAGIAFGFMTGGIISGVAASFVFPMAAFLALLLGLSALAIPREIGPTPARKARLKGAVDRYLAAGLACNASDRFLAGITTPVIPLLLGGEAFNLSPFIISLVMAAPLLMAVIGGVFSGVAVDRFGPLVVRSMGCAAYAGGLVLVIFGAGLGPWALVFASAVMGFGVMAVLPTALVIGTSQGEDSGDPAIVGWIQAGGQVGYITGVLGAWIFTLVQGQVTPLLVVSAATLYITWNIGWLGLLKVRSGEPTAREVQVDAIGPVARSSEWPMSRPRPQGVAHRRRMGSDSGSMVD